ncbi:hypothetical protein ILUMI_21599 [Ignelater luminosus]|uniref:Peptidase M13 N-terminal domain-containing protein n=1 Tax=Ignelater luminosus TaxID=2038154 RepID=A0A8K0CIL4_IGNLU|nr:hypothetical protein ILUMI_21599 [Ignelater luminosus]
MNEDEHIPTQKAKKLYQACMNTQAIEEDGLKTMKEVVQAIGGWPLVEDDNWDETNFDWIQATFALRDLGYPFNIFLTVLPNADKLRVRVPFSGSIEELYDVFSRRDHQVKNIAQAFGANISNISGELNDLHQFSDKMRKQIEHGGLISYPSHKISEIQNNIGMINWDDFIHKLIGSTLSISSEKYITIVEEANIKKRLQTLSETPKRCRRNCSTNCLSVKSLDQFFNKDVELLGIQSNYFAAKLAYEAYRLWIQTN